MHRTIESAIAAQHTEERLRQAGQARQARAARPPRPAGSHRLWSWQRSDGVAGSPRPL
jgi:hypothetical protein